MHVGGEGWVGSNPRAALTVRIDAALQGIVDLTNEEIFGIFGIPPPV